MTIFITFGVILALSILGAYYAERMRSDRLFALAATVAGTMLFGLFIMGMVLVSFEVAG